MSRPLRRSPHTMAAGVDWVRDGLPLVVAAAPLAGAVALAYRDGGYFIASWGVAAMVLLGVLAVAVLVSDGTLGGALGLVAISGWGGLAAWQGLSALWADEPASSTAAMSLTLLYAAAFALVLVASRGVATLRALVPLALLVPVIVTATALGARLLPDLVSGDDQSGRLATPLTYWNNLALIFAFGFVLAVGIAADPSRGRPLRAAAAAAVPLFPLGILFTQSRGALLVTIAGCALLLGLARGRVETLWMLLVATAVSLPLMLYANAQEALSTDYVLSTEHDAEGRRVVLGLLIAMAATAAAALAIGPLARALAQPRRRLLVGAGVASVVLVAAVVALGARPPAGGPVAWADRQIEAFQTFDPRARDEASTVAERLVVATGSGRWQNWSVAADGFAEAPLAGTGAGDYRFRWAEQREIDISVRNAHSLYLEVLGESGLIGLALLLTPLTAVGVAIGLALRSRPPAPLARDLGIVAGAGATVALHLAGDWAWQMPAAVLPAVALGAAAIAASAAHRGRDGRPRRPVAWSIAAASVVALLLVAGPVASSARVDGARDLAASGDLTGALDAAREAAALQPQSAEAALLEANLLADLGRSARADDAFAAAVGRSPRDWAVRADWAAALIRRGDLRAARPLISSALALNPREPRLALMQQAVRT